MAPNLTKRIREYAPTIIILILLAAVLGFYYLKYVPERRADINRNAFLELNQIQFAFKFQNQAYQEAIQNIIKQNTVDPNALIAFNYNPADHVYFKNSNQVKATRFDRSGSGGRWQMYFPVFDKDTLIYPLSKSLYPLMTGIVSTYKDIFDSYLLIRNVQIPDAPVLLSRKLAKKPSVIPGFVHVRSNDSKGEGESKDAKIIYQSSNLSVDFLVNPDSLLKRNEGFSMLNIHDVTIEGNAYKLFLYPFEIGDQRLTLTGLISEANYRQATQKIPFSFFTMFSILLLLLIIHLPILKIYILGPNERIRDTDIRMIIGSYFIAAFFGFFLFTKLFLDKEQKIQNRKHLDLLSEKIRSNFYAELDSMDLQLGYLDSTFNAFCRKIAADSTKKDTVLLHAMLAPTKKSEIINYLDNRFKPGIYPYPNNVFWISDSGRWVARWGFKAALSSSSLIDVKDRFYYKDFKQGEALWVPGINDSITIQPTLSKLEGEYVITVARRSHVAPYAEKISKDSTIRIEPLLIGMSSRMHSMTCTLLPPGYGFSIIDENGTIQFDAKTGRPLLSNILKELDDPGGIRQSAVFRNSRYYDHLTLRGRDMALLSTPVKGTPYQLLVYYNKVRSDDFQEHLVLLAAGLIGMVIVLLIFSSLINQWSKTKTRMLESRSHHFEWLHPSADPLKEKYYLHLIRWMLLLLGVYLAAWFVMEAIVPESEFSLLFISLLFPFYIALYYYELRERYYDVQENRTGVNWYFSRPSLVLRGLMLIIIVLINCGTSLVKFSGALALPVLITQLIWAAMIGWSTFRFRHDMMGAMIPEESTAAGKSVQTKKPDPPFKIPLGYIWSILIGVVLISIIPASGIFWLFFRQENGLYQNADQLTIARQIDQRRQDVNQRIKDYKLNPAHAADSSAIDDLKFRHGIYLLSGRVAAINIDTPCIPLIYPSSEYIHLHKKIFPTDSLIINWIDASDSAADGTWYFGRDSLGRADVPALVFLNRKDENNPHAFHLLADISASQNVFGILIHSFSGTGAGFAIFFIVGLCFSLTIAYFLTLSLTKRIFLMELQKIDRLTSHQHNLAEKYYGQSGISQEMRLMIFKTCHELGIHSLDMSEAKIPYTDPLFPSLDEIYHFEKKLPLRMLEAKMPWLIETLEPVYINIWKSLSERQKFILFDFAQDGFANYKAGKQLQELIAKGILIFEDLRLRVMTLSFQEYILQMKEDPDLNVFLTKSSKEDTWKKLRSPLLILLTSIGIFIFVTQEDAYKKITGLLATLTSLLPLLTSMFNKAPAKGSGD